MIALLVIFVFSLVILFALSERKKKNILGIPSVPGWPIFGNALEFGDNSETINDITRLIAKNGKLINVRILNTSNILSIDYDFVEFILNSQKVLSKSHDYRYLHKWLGKGLLTSEGKLWKKRRRMITPAFHFSILEQFIENFEANGLILMEKLSNEVGKGVFDIYRYINLYTLDIICETAMGISVNAQMDRDSTYVKNVKEMCRIAIDRAFAIFKSNDFLYIFSRDFYKEIKYLKQLHAVTNSVIDTRRKELEKNKLESCPDVDEFGRKKKMAFLDILLQSNIEGDPLSREDIREEVDTFMFEGHDTTSSALGFAAYLLSRHSDVQDRAVIEQKEIFGDQPYRSATYEDLQSMKYLEMVIKESLRLYPPVPMYGRRTKEDIVYKGNIIPKDVNIVVFAYGVLRDPNNFVEPEKFNPSRFEEIDGSRPFSFIPFSAGPRNCIGQKFAMLELKSTLSKILKNYVLLPAETDEKLILVSEAVLKSKNGINVKLEKRVW